MKIEQLPVEMLMKVFRYLPTCSEVSLVNKLFYDIVCKANDPNFCLRIDQRFFDRFFRDNVMDTQCLQSMKTSNREITKVEIGPFECDLNLGCGIRYHFLNQDQRPIVSVVESFSATLTSLKYTNVSSATVDESTFMEILSSIPNVSHLDLRCLRFQRSRGIGNDESTHRDHGDDGGLNLMELTTLSVAGCSDDIFAVFYRLPIGVLTELEISNFCWNSLTPLLDRQLNIKKLKLEFGQDDDVAIDIFDKLNLESLELSGHKINSVKLGSILWKQIELKSLTLFDRTVVDGPAMTAIAHNLDLERLAINVTWTPDASFVQIRNLKKLKDLTILHCGGHESSRKFRTLAESDNASVRKLNLQGFVTMPVDLFRVLAKSAPRLRILIAQHSSRDRRELDAIMRHFNFVEVLAIRIGTEPLVDTIEYFNPKLRELSIVVASSDLLYNLWLAKLVAAYPYLKKLKLMLSDMEANTLEMRPILSGFTYLECLVIKSDCPFIVEDLDYLQHRKNNLKFVSLGQLPTLSDDKVTKLRRHFPVVNLDKFKYLNIACDRYTMSRESQNFF